MKKIITVSFYLGILSLLVAGCSNQKNNMPENLPSDSLKAVVANSLDNYAATIMESPIDTSSVFGLLTSFLTEQPAVYGSAFALVPVIEQTDTLRYSPYVYRTPQGFVSKYLERSYDYTRDSWFSEPVKQKKGYWSEPYFDEGGGEAWMITYSVPLFTPDTILLGVITADLEIKK